MTEWLNQAFSGGVSLERANPIGIVMMALAVALIAAAGPLCRRLEEEKRQTAVMGMKIAGLLVCALGAMISIL